MRLLVTRPRPDAEALAAKLEALGHEAIVSPVLGVEFVDPGPLSFSDAQALIATSRNSLRALALTPSLGEAIRLPLFAVGKGTARLAQELGFERVTTGGGSAESLLPVIVAACEPGTGPLMHLAGEKRAWDLKGALEREGFTVRQQVLYRTVPATDLSSAAANALESGALDGVILMSPLSAKTYARLVQAQGLAAQAAKLVHYCLSANVAGALDSPENVEVRVSATPSQEDLLALIGGEAAN